MATQNLHPRKSLEGWIQESIESVSSLSEKRVAQILSNVGIDANLIFKEKDSLRVRLYISELIMKRKQCNIDYFNDYLAVINRLLCYAEYLECDGKVLRPIDAEAKSLEVKTLEEKIISEFSKRDRLEDSLIISYYLSRVNMDGVKALGYKNFTVAFEGLAKILDQKPSTIKNMRDEFDPYFDNGRVGWYQRGMSVSRKKIYDQMELYSNEELTIIVNRILDDYKNIQNEQDEKVNHKRIKISSGEMKEIKSRKK